MRTLFAILVLSVWSWIPAGAAAPKANGHGTFSDAEIESTIKAKLAKSKIGKDGFQVRVKDGVVTWTGITTVMQHKGAATRMAKTAGAIRVVNNIKINEPGKDTGAPGTLRRAEVKIAKPD